MTLICRSQAARQPGSGKANEWLVTYVLLLYANPEQSPFGVILRVTCVTRGKVSVSSAGLRYVLLPPERASLAVSRPGGRLLTPGGNARARLVPRNRERELGLDRRETG